MARRSLKGALCPVVLHDQSEFGSMMDIILLGTAIAFFALCFAYTRACDKL